jgi:hypothetical protein
MSHAFGLRHHPQQVLAEDLANVLFTVATLQQLISNVRQHGNVTRAFGHIVGAIKVCPDPDMIDARNFHDVIDVVD